MKTFRNTVRASKHGLILKNVISDGFPDLLMSRCPEVPKFPGGSVIIPTITTICTLYSVFCTLHCTLQCFFPLYPVLCFGLSYPALPPPSLSSSATYTNPCLYSTIQSLTL